MAAVAPGPHPHYDKLNELFAHELDQELRRLCSYGVDRYPDSVVSLVTRLLSSIHRAQKDLSSTPARIMVFLRFYKHQSRHLFTYKLPLDSPLLIELVIQHDAEHAAAFPDGVKRSRIEARCSARGPGIGNSCWMARSSSLSSHHTASQVQGSITKRGSLGSITIELCGMLCATTTECASRRGRRSSAVTSLCSSTL